MNENSYFNTVSAEEVDSLLDLALSAKAEDATYALDESSQSEFLEDSAC